MSAGQASALDGIRVVEIAHERSVLAGKMLADMGADVILVEPPRGSSMRSLPPFVDDEPDPERSLYWWHYNTSKRGVTLDLESEKGRGLFAKLVSGADLVLEAEDAGRLCALGIDYEDLSPDSADLIWISIKPFGREGPRRDEPVTDLTLLAGGGPVWSCGYDDHSLPPVRGGGNQAYNTASHFAVLSALTALLHRMLGGEGQLVDVNMHAAMNVTTEMASYHWLVQQGTVQRQTGRHALEQPSLPTQITCADGRHVTTGVPPRWPHEFNALHDWLEELDLIEKFPEAVFLKMAAEREFIDFSKIGEDDEVTAFMSAGREALNLIAEHVSAYDFFLGSQECGISTGVIYSPEEVFEDPHFVARGFPVEVEHPELGRSVRYPGAPYLLHKGGWRISRRAPQCGEHNDEVFRALGLAADEIEKLRSDGVI